MMASRLSPSSSQSSLSASNSSLFEPDSGKLIIERWPSPPAVPSSSPSPTTPTPTTPRQPSHSSSSGSSNTAEASATFTIRRKKKRPPLTRAATIAVTPTPSQSSSSSYASSSISSNAAQTSSSASASPSSATSSSAPPPPSFELEDLKIAFSLMDTNRDGLISCCELWDALMALGFFSFSPSEIENMIKSASNGKEWMTEDEFVKWFSSAASGVKPNAPSSSSSLAHSLASLKAKPNSNTSSSPAAAAAASSSSPTTTPGRSASLTSLDTKFPFSSTSSPSTSSGKNNKISEEKRTAAVIDPELEKDLRAAFAVFDQDSNGFLSKSELKSALLLLKEEEMSERELDNLLRTADRDQDGQIGFEDFFSILSP